MQQLPTHYRTFAETAIWPDMAANSSARCGGYLSTMTSLSDGVRKCAVIYFRINPPDGPQSLPGSLSPFPILIP